MKNCRFSTEAASENAHDASQKPTRFFPFKLAVTNPEYEIQLRLEDTSSPVGASR